MKNFIKVVVRSSGKVMRINVNNIMYYELANGYDNLTVISFVDGSDVWVKATPEEIDDKIEGKVNIDSRVRI